MQTTHSEPFWANFREDLWRHYVYHPGLSTLGKLRVAATVEGIWAMAAYRYGRALERPPRASLLTRLGWSAYHVVELGVRLLTGIALSVDAEIGPGFYIGHFGSIHVGPGVRIGRHSSIGQMCIVASADGRSLNAPTLGERVYVGAGAKVVGKLSIGDDAAVGAGAVVGEDVPPRAVVVGVPARVVSQAGSGDFIYLGPKGEAGAQGASNTQVAAVVQDFAPAAGGGSPTG